MDAAMETLRLRPAKIEEFDAILSMVRAFYQEDAIAFDNERVRRGLTALLTEPDCGALLMLESDTLPVAGYVALGWCFSMEHGGRFALLDELYLRPEARGRGWGKIALTLVRNHAQAHGYCAVRLEVNHHNVRAKSLYLQQGYRDDQRDILTLPLETPA